VRLAHPHPRIRRVNPELGMPSGAPFIGARLRCIAWLLASDLRGAELGRRRLGRAGWRWATINPMASSAGPTTLRSRSIRAFEPEAGGFPAEHAAFQESDRHALLG